MLLLRKIQKAQTLEFKRHIFLNYCYITNIFHIYFFNSVVNTRNDITITYFGK